MTATDGPAIRSATGELQVLESLLTNRTKRHRRGRFLVQGVRPITQAVAHGWPLEAVLYADGRRLSAWANDLRERLPPTTAWRATAPSLLARLAGKEETGAEVVAVAAIPDRTIADADPGRGAVVVLDRPASPGNVGTIVRSADALGAAAVVVAGHAADPYDPKAVRATTGSLFALPVIPVPSAAEALDELRARTPSLHIVGADEGGEPVSPAAVAGPLALVLGSEQRGLSRAVRERCDAVIAIPQRGSASSLNVAAAASILLYVAST